MMVVVEAKHPDDGRAVVDRITGRMVTTLWDRASQRLTRSRAVVLEARWHQKIDRAARIWSVEGTI